ncbi:polysaccharide deacetylase family protein [Thioalkalivibrio sp. XN279]|uniref:polysaccharide deacetylase family protein n=1 Tax=Thioalkalivibrio sp. XN279 TaxID=2714953 RepID=UPI00140D49FC|nr:polysaccharide deacetylase family protein [Thioalkalivibrio sp. XN279]NHA15375.1 polysaccharide deacetylase family protein [Thioalkalivibrio sp. XN279]
MAMTGRSRGQAGAIVLMYHSVADREEAAWIDPSNHVAADVFEQQMKWLAEHRKVISLARLVEILRDGGDVEEGTIVITFDDGYRDNLTVAAPILQRFGLPATLFLPTGYIDRGETQWVDQAYTAFQHRSVVLLHWGERVTREYSLEDPASREQAYQAVCEDLLVAGPDERRRKLRDLLNQLRPSAVPPRLTLTWDEVNELTGTAPFSLGGHTVEHTDLTTVSLDAARDELAVCKGRIEEMTGSAPRYFSFCYGRNSGALRALLPELGIEAAFGSGAGGPFVTAAHDPLYLPRIAAQADLSRFQMSLDPANRGAWRRLGR